LNFPILETKLFTPPLTRDRINRFKLIERINEGLSSTKPLVLLCAPAGYGKTSLLSEWVSSRKEEIQIAWLTVEPGDNDPVRFFSYLAAAIKKYLPEISDFTQDLFASPSLPGIQDVAGMFINPLSRIENSLVIILDDVHAIQNADLFSGLAYLIDHLPPQIHLILSSRSDPPLPIHRYRARGQLVELRLHDLRFSQEEIRNLIAKTSHADLSEQELAFLESRTEGWIAGLRMLLLSAYGKQDIHEILKSLSGQHRYIMDFLAEEAFQLQSVEIQTFLLKTSILERFNPSLCEMVTQQSNSSEILSLLERNNCFLIPLDEQGVWFRYHHLFADLLKVRLTQLEKKEAGFRTALHEKAGIWFYENQFFEEAVQHFILAENITRASEIVEQKTIELFSRGRLHQLLSWIRLLPEDLAAQRPGLNVYQAWALGFASKAEEAEAKLQRAETKLLESETSIENRRRMNVEVRAVRSLLAIIGGNIQTAIALTDLPDDIVPIDYPFARSVHRWAVGYGWRILGNLEKAEFCFREVVEIGYTLDNLFTIVSGCVDLGEILRQKGELIQAEEIFRKVLERVYQYSNGPGFVGRLESFLANILIEQRKFDEARILINRAIEHNLQWENPNHATYAWLIKARYFNAIQMVNESYQALEEALHWIERAPVVSSLRSSLELMKVNLWVATDSRSLLEKWVSKMQVELPTPSHRLNESEELLSVALARSLISIGQKQAAFDVLSHLVSVCRNKNRIAMLVQALVLQTCATSPLEKAIVPMREALQIGLVRGFRQIFVENGLWILPALEKCQEMNGVSDILSAIYKNHPKNLVESVLTNRETDILRWMAAGLSNQEIGKKLFISAGTVKTHTAAIYRKLDVANRTEAIARAKDIGLI